jgi:hypothetical protein
MDVSSFLVNLHSCKSIIKTFTKDTECTVYGGHGVKERTPQFLGGFFLDMTGGLVGLEINGNHLDQSPNAHDGNCGEWVYVDIHWYSPCCCWLVKVL